MPKSKRAGTRPAGRPRQDFSGIAVHIEALVRLHGKSINSVIKESVFDAADIREGLPHRSRALASNIKRRYYEFVENHKADGTPPGGRHGHLLSPGFELLIGYQMQMLRQAERAYYRTT